MVRMRFRHRNHSRSFNLKEEDVGGGIKSLLDARLKLLIQPRIELSLQ